MNMELHNTIEDLVISKVTGIFESIEKEGNPENFCTCQQCRMDTVCYALNRSQPHYIISNRGAARVNQESHEHQQKEADLVALIHEGIKQVNHNQRPNFLHSPRSAFPGEGVNRPVFNIPTIVGRLFNGNNFSPLSDVKVELLRNGDLVAMKDGNWQNPYTLVANTEGTFSFWPNPVPALTVDEHRIFEFSIRVEAGDDLETLYHFFKLPVISELQTANTFSLHRTFKLPDLYMFPPGEAEKNGYTG
jgi:competence protein ComFB